VCIDDVLFLPKNAWLTYYFLAKLDDPAEAAAKLAQLKINSRLNNFFTTTPSLTGYNLAAF